MKLRHALAGLTLTSALALAAASANAADMYVPGPGGYKDAPWAPEWAGFYIGATGGQNWGHDTTPPVWHFDGPNIGGDIGYNFQRGPFVFGIEADINGSGNGSVVQNGLLFLNDWGVVAGRVGYAWDRLLIFAKGGFAWGDLGTTATVNGHQNFLASGWEAGAGLEYKIAHHWSAKVEWEHVDFTDTGNYPYGPVKVDAVLFGVNWHFGGWDYAPLK